MRKKNCICKKVLCMAAAIAMLLAAGCGPRDADDPVATDVPVGTGGEEPIPVEPTPAPPLAATGDEPVSTGGPLRTNTPASDDASTQPPAATDAPEKQAEAAEPEAIPTEAIAAGGDAGSDSGQYDAYFNNTVFVGDSVTQGLENYVHSMRKSDASFLGGARFLTAKSYGLRDGCKETTAGAKHKMTYQGQEVTIHDGLRQMGASRAFILLGLNDWAGSQIEHCIGEYGQMIDLILAANPGLELIVQSVTPVCAEKETDKINSRNMGEFNVALQQLCSEKGVAYIDVSTPLKNSSGKLNPDYSSDNYVHLNKSGLKIWVRTLREYARAHS